MVKDQKKSSKKYGLIYCVTNLINGKKYVGQTTFSIEKRKREHCRAVKYRKSRFHFHNALRRYGFNNFKWRVVARASTKKELQKLEIRYIAKWHTQDRCFGYNLTSGGEGTPNHTTSEEIRQNLRILNTGKKLSASTVQKMIEYRTGRKQSKTWIANRVASLKRNGKCYRKRIAREIRNCECGCGGTFECRVNSKRRFLQGHGQRIKSKEYWLKYFTGIRKLW